MEKKIIWKKLSVLIEIQLTLLFVICGCSQAAQFSEIDKSIAEIRKGEIIVKAKSGANVETVQEGVRT